MNFSTTEPSPRLSWEDLEKYRSAVTDNQWEWVKARLHEGRSVPQFHNRPGVRFDSDSVLRRACVRLLRCLLGLEIVVPSKDGSVEGKTCLGPGEIEWRDLAIFRSHLTEKQWQCVTQYFRDGLTPAQIHGSTHVAKHNHVLGRASVRLIRLLMGFSVRDPKPSLSPPEPPSINNEKSADGNSTPPPPPPP